MQRARAVFTHTCENCRKSLRRTLEGKNANIGGTTGIHLRCSNCRTINWATKEDLDDRKHYGYQNPWWYVEPEQAIYLPKGGAL